MALPLLFVLLLNMPALRQNWRVPMAAAKQNTKYK
jgi:hypothetical protein